MLSSCQRDLDNIVVDTIIGPDTAWVALPDSSMLVGQLQQELLLTPSTDSFLLTPGAVTTVNTSSGLRTTISAGSLVNDSLVPAFGSVTVHSLLLNKKGDYIRMGLSTMNNDRALEVAGSYLLQFSQHQQTLQLGQGRQIISQFDANNPTQGLSVYTGASTYPFWFNWTRPLDSTANYVIPSGQTYGVYTNALGWISAARVFGNLQQGPPGIIHVNLPPNYTNKNTRAYIVINNRLSVIPMYGNSSLKQFISLEVPSGEQARIVVLSKQDTDYYMGSEQISILPGSGTPQTVSVTPTITSFNNMINFLSSL